MKEEGAERRGGGWDAGEEPEKTAAERKERNFQPWQQSLLWS